MSRVHVLLSTLYAHLQQRSARVSRVQGSGRTLDAHLQQVVAQNLGGAVEEGLGGGHLLVHVLQPAFRV